MAKNYLLHLRTKKIKGQSSADIVAKLHTMFPDGAMIGNLYVQTRATPEEQLVAVQEYIKKFPDEPSGYNTMAYYEFAG